MTTSTNLNPLAPEYIPILPGVAPSRYAPPPPSAAHLHRPPPPPLFPSPQLFTYIPSISQQPFYRYGFTHRFTSQNGVRANPPPPPRAEGGIHYGPTGRVYTRPSGGRGRGRGRGRGSFRRSTVDKNGGASRLSFERRLNNEESCVGVSKSFQNRGKKVENRHRVMPVTRDDEEKTTVMIKNIPYDCPREELISLLDEFCLLENDKAKTEGSSSNREAEEALTCAYDFVYLPIDFRSKRSRGFAFVNFTNARAVWSFFVATHKTKWGFVERNNWPKIIQIVSAEIQGKEALVNHFSDSVFECETDEFLPAYFSPPRDGFGQPVELTVVGKRRAPPLGAVQNSLN